MAVKLTTQDRYRQTMTAEVQCVEVCEGGSGSVIGYAVFFSGGWDAWVMRNRRRHRLFRKAASLTREEAIEAIKRTWREQQ